MTHPLHFGIVVPAFDAAQQLDRASGQASRRRPPGAMSWSSMADQPHEHAPWMRGWAAARKNTSSTCKAAITGTGLSINHGVSSLSVCAIGHIGSD